MSETAEETARGTGNALAALSPNPDWRSLPLFDRSNWTRVRFGDFAQNVNERVEPADAADERYVGLEHLDPQNLHIHRWGKGSDVIGTKLRFRKGDIIFGRRRAYQRKLAVAEFNGICSAHAMVVRAKPDLVLPEFLPFLMMSDRFMSRAVEISVGSLSPTINWRTLKEEEFDLPPLEVQRRIAEVLWAVDTLTNQQERLLEAIVIFQESFIDNHFPNNLKFAGIKKLRFGIPGFSTLQQVARRITDGVHLSPHFESEGIPFLLVSNISSGEIDWKIDRWISHETYKELTRSVKPEVGDVLYSVVASYGVPIFIDWDKEFSFQRHIALIKPDPLKINGRYLYYFLKSKMGKKQADIYAEGNAQLTITLSSLSRFVIPTPPIKEQQRFIDQLDDIDSLRIEASDVVFNLRMVFDALINRLAGTK